MAFEVQRTMGTPMSLPFKIWKLGEPHPFADHKIVNFKAPTNHSTTISFEELNSRYLEWKKDGLKLTETRPVSIDIEIADHCASTQIDLQLLERSGEALELSEKENPFNGPLENVNWCLFLDTALRTGAITVSDILEKTRHKSFRVHYGIVQWEDNKLFDRFNWPAIFLVHTFLKYAKYTGKLEEYKGVAGQLRLANEARMDDICNVYSAARYLGWSKEMGYELIVLSIKDIKGYIPYLLEWNKSGRIDLANALKRFSGKFPKECPVVFEEIQKNMGPGNPPSDVA